MSTMKTGRPREFDRSKVLEIAVEVFWEKGFEGTSKRDLMEATGVASQSLYNAFGDKRELFDEAVRYYVSQREQMLTDMLQRPGSPLDNVCNVVRMWGEMGPESEKGCLVANCLAEFGRSGDELIDFLNQQILAMQVSFAEALERARRAGEINAEANVDAIAATLVCTAKGLALMRRSGAPDKLLQQVVEGTLNLLRSTGDEY